MLGGASLAEGRLSPLAKTDELAVGPQRAGHAGSVVSLVRAQAVSALDRESALRVVVMVGSAASEASSLSGAVKSVVVVPAPVALIERGRLSHLLGKLADPKEAPSSFCWVEEGHHHIHCRSCAIVVSGRVDVHRFLGGLGLDFIENSIHDVDSLPSKVVECSGAVSHHVGVPVFVSVDLGGANNRAPGSGGGFELVAGASVDGL